MFTPPHTPPHTYIYTYIYEIYLDNQGYFGEVVKEGNMCDYYVLFIAGQKLGI